MVKDFLTNETAPTTEQDAESQLENKNCWLIWPCPYQFNVCQLSSISYCYAKNSPVAYQKLCNIKQTSWTQTSRNLGKM